MILDISGHDHIFPIAVTACLGYLSTMGDNKVLLSVVQLEARTGLSRFTWRAMIARGDVPVIRIGRRVFVAETDLSEFISRHRVPARNDGKGTRASGAKAAQGTGFVSAPTTAPAGAQRSAARC
jgi:Helix-turn-helix domain